MHVSTGPLRSVPGYAFPFTEQTEHIQKRARLQPVGCCFHANTRRWGWMKSWKWSCLHGGWTVEPGELDEKEFDEAG